MGTAAPELSGSLSGRAWSSLSCGPITGGTGQRGVLGVVVAESDPAGGDVDGALLVGVAGCGVGCAGVVVDGDDGVVVVGVEGLLGVVGVVGIVGIVGVVVGVVGALVAGGFDVQAPNVVCGTNTVPLPGTAHCVPPCTNCTLPLPGGSPAGHSTLWP